eukprot:NODE_1903_length_730_cov_317.425844_g1600_i0.p1 GENE.NODE_1903_length_730_cov_317.425844_g1600_i0~~NODE_1903_length_730_cov_317.425844_g1600_i0.p1  ORF type:complete len:180 (-),score=47.75 NODE_1903_length_730_cov_317.425844_g1600_i0:121-660(-)
MAFFDSLSCWPSFSDVVPYTFGGSSYYPSCAPAAPVLPTYGGWPSFCGGLESFPSYSAFDAFAAPAPVVESFPSFGCSFPTVGTWDSLYTGSSAYSGYSAYSPFCGFPSFEAPLTTLSSLDGSVSAALPGATTSIQSAPLSTLVNTLDSTRTIGAATGDLTALAGEPTVAWGEWRFGGY